MRDGIFRQARCLRPGCGGWGRRPWRRRRRSAARATASHSASRPRVSIGTAVWRCTLNCSRRDIGRVLERRVGIALHRRQRARRSSCRASSNEQLPSRRAVSRSATAGKRLDVELDRLQRIFGQRPRCPRPPRRSARRHNAPCRRAITGCSKRLERRHRLLPQRNCRHAPSADTSAAVITACTPARAARLSYRSIGCGRAPPSCAGSRHAAGPAASTSSTYSPRPRRKRRSSMRSTGLPMKTFPGRG